MYQRGSPRPAYDGAAQFRKGASASHDRGARLRLPEGVGIVKHMLRNQWHLVVMIVLMLVIMAALMLMPR